MARGALLVVTSSCQAAYALHAPPLPALPRHAAVTLSQGAPLGVSALSALPGYRARLVLPSMHAAAEEFVSDPGAPRLGRGARLRKKLRQLVLCVLLTVSLRLSPARATTAGALDAPSAPAVSVKAPASAQRMAMDRGRNPWARLRLRRRRPAAPEDGRTGAAAGGKSAATLVTSPSPNPNPSPNLNPNLNPNPDPNPNQVATAPARAQPSLSGSGVVSSVVQAASDLSKRVDVAERDTIVVLGVSALVPPG